MRLTKKHCELQTKIVACFVCLVLLLLGSLLFGFENVMILRISTIIAILILGVEDKAQLRFCGWVREQMKKISSKIMAVKGMFKRNKEDRGTKDKVNDAFLLRIPMDFFGLL